MDFPILPVEAGVPVGHMLGIVGKCVGWFLLNGDCGMRTVGGEIDEGDEIDDHGGDRGEVYDGCCTFRGMAGGSPAKILLVA